MSAVTVPHMAVDETLNDSITILLDSLQKILVGNRVR